MKGMQIDLGASEHITTWQFPSIFQKSCPRSPRNKQICPLPDSSTEAISNSLACSSSDCSSFFMTTDLRGTMSGGQWNSSRSGTNELNVNTSKPGYASRTLSNSGAIGKKSDFHIMDPDEIYANYTVHDVKTVLNRLRYRDNLLLFSSTDPSQGWT